MYSLIFSKGGLSQKTFFFSKSLNVLVESCSARRPVVSDLVFESYVSARSQLASLSGWPFYLTKLSSIPLVQWVYGLAPSCRNGVGRQKLLPRSQVEGAEVRRRAFSLLSYSSTDQHPTAPVLLVCTKVPYLSSPRGVRLFSPSELSKIYRQSSSNITDLKISGFHKFDIT